MTNHRKAWELAALTWRRRQPALQRQYRGHRLASVTPPPPRRSVLLALHLSSATSLCYLWAAAQEPCSTRRFRTRRHVQRLELLSAARLTRRRRLLPWRQLKRPNAASCGTDGARAARAAGGRSAANAAMSRQLRAGRSLRARRSGLRCGHKWSDSAARRSAPRNWRALHPRAAESSALRLQRARGAQRSTRQEHLTSGPPGVKLRTSAPPPLRSSEPHAEAPGGAAAFQAVPATGRRQKQRRRAHPGAKAHASSASRRAGTAAQPAPPSRSMAAAKEGGGTRLDRLLKLLESASRRARALALP